MLGFSDLRSTQICTSPDFFGTNTIPAHDGTDAASTPKQYKKVMTCFVSVASSRPDASLNCWNRHFQRGQS